VPEHQSVLSSLEFSRSEATPMIALLTRADVYGVHRLVARQALPAFSGKPDARGCRRRRGMQFTEQQFAA